jgi:hypothetical protein
MIRCGSDVSATATGERNSGGGGKQLNNDPFHPTHNEKGGAP